MQGAAAQVQEARLVEVAGPDGAGEALTFPDACKEPAPPAEQVPVPYPDTDRMKDSSSKGVKITGAGAMTKPGTPATPTTGDEPGTGRPAGVTGGLPGPLRGADPLVVAGLVVALVAIVMVVTGDVGWAEKRLQIIPVKELEVEPIGTVITIRETYNVYDGGLYAIIIAVTVLLLALASVAALIALSGRWRRPLLLLCAGLAAGALVASLAGSWAFDAWAEGEGFEDWGAGSSITAGTVGSLLVVVLSTASIVRTGVGGLRATG